MLLNIRYDNTVKNIILDQDSTDQLLCTLYFEFAQNDRLDPIMRMLLSYCFATGFSGVNKEKLVQQLWNEAFNKKEYNNMHKLNRKLGFSKAQIKNNERISFEPLQDEMADSTMFYNMESEIITNESNEIL